MTLTLSLLPACAEESEPSELHREITEAFTRLGDWLGGAADDAQKAAEDAAGWAEALWDSIREGSAGLTEEVKKGTRELLDWAQQHWQELSDAGVRFFGGVGQWFAEVWGKVSAAVSRFFNDDLGSLLEKFSQDGETMTEVMEHVESIVTRETAEVVSAFVAETAAARDSAVPEAVTAYLDSLLKPAQEGGEAPDEQVLFDYLAGLGVDKDAFEAAISERLQQRLVSLGLQAESASLREYMEKHGLSFSSIALRAQDRLDRYASGELELSDEALQHAVDQVDEWSDTAGVDETELALDIIRRMDAK